LLAVADVHGALEVSFELVEVIGSPEPRAALRNISALPRLDRRGIPVLGTKLTATERTAGLRAR
jgi:hypothetical protein